MGEHTTSGAKCNGVSSGDNFTMAEPRIGVASSFSNSSDLHNQHLLRRRKRVLITS